MCESQIIKERASARGNTGKGVKKMKRKCFFGIRKDLINETKSALRRKAEREKKVEEPATAEQAEEMAKDAEILAFLELFQKQDSPLDLTVYVGVRKGLLHLESILPLPAGVRYDVASLNLISAEKRAEIEEELKGNKDIICFSSKEEAVKAMTTI